MGDKYIEEVIRKGDVASEELSDLAELTRDLPGERIETVNYGSSTVNLLHAPEGMNLAAIPLGGVHSLNDDLLTDSYESAVHFVMKAVEMAEYLGFHPVSITNILTMSDIDNEKVVPDVKSGLYDAAKQSGIWVATGETAGHGDRVTVPFNISGLLLAYVPKSEFDEGINNHGNIQFAVFDHKNKGIYQNSDGNGTKPEWNEMLHDLGLPFMDRMWQDGEAMLYDDAVKINAEIVADGRVLELGNRNTGIERILRNHLAALNRDGIKRFVTVEYMKNRIRSNAGIPMSLEGTTVGLVDEDVLKNLLSPQEDDVLMLLYNPSSRNLRANGITDQRGILTDMYGPQWHKNPQLRGLLLNVSTPSTVFYPLFREYLNNGDVTSVGHSSGGAYDGKLAKVLGKHGFSADIFNTVPAWDVQEQLSDWLGETLEERCAKKPYRAEAWVTTGNPARVAERAEQYGLKAVEAGTIYKSDEPRLTVTFPDLGKVEYSGI